jgi:hypothetical protein
MILIINVIHASYVHTYINICINLMMDVKRKIKRESYKLLTNCNKVCKSIRKLLTYKIDKNVSS